MKAILFGFIFALILSSGTAQAQKLEKVWETTGMKTPESVLYDTERDVIYVANINGAPAEKNGTGFITILSANGNIKTLEWVTGLNAPKGMAIFDNKLYVSDISQLVEIDIKKGEIIKKYDVPNSVFLNDVSACKNGMIFVSDTRTAKIHVLKNGTLKVWLSGEPLENPNGLMAENGKLFIGDTNIYEVDIKTKKINMIIENAGGVDGLEKNNDGEFVFSNWPGRIFINHNGKTIKLLDTTTEEINTADLDYDLKHDLILLPTFFDNRIIAYKIVF
ncbi:MAG: hypothetical protein GQ525_14575 [Draconibacterium sp.]|nr:hypothetical protein [Draconibacterium sp.]